MVALPWPAVGDPSAIQDATVAADHEQSRAVVIVMVPVPPSAPKLLGLGDAATSHLLALGATTDVDDEEQAGAIARLNDTDTIRMSLGSHSRRRSNLSAGRIARLRASDRELLAIEETIHAAVCRGFVLSCFSPCAASAAASPN